MFLKDQYIINNNLPLKKYLRENSYFYKNLNRDYYFINEMINLMKKEYKMTLPDKLDKIKNDISMLNTFMDIVN